MKILGTYLKAATLKNCLMILSADNKSQKMNWLILTRMTLSNTLDNFTRSVYLRISYFVFEHAILIWICLGILFFLWIFGFFRKTKHFFLSLIDQIKTPDLGTFLRFLIFVWKIIKCWKQIHFRSKKSTTIQLSSAHNTRETAKRTTNRSTKIFGKTKTKRSLEEDWSSEEDPQFRLKDILPSDITKENVWSMNREVSSDHSLNQRQWNITFWNNFTDTNLNWFLHDKKINKRFNEQKQHPKKVDQINDKMWVVFEADREAYRSSSTLDNWDQLNVRYLHPIQYSIRWPFLHNLRDRFELILNDWDHKCDSNIELNIWWDYKRHSSGSTIFQDQLSKNILCLLHEDLSVPPKL